MSLHLDLFKQRIEVTSYYMVFVNSPSKIFLLLSGGRPHASIYLAPKIADRYRIIREWRSPIIHHPGLARRAGAP
jgi:hypothetical protein